MTTSVLRSTACRRPFAGAWPRFDGHCSHWPAMRGGRHDGRSVATARQPPPCRSLRCKRSFSTRAPQRPTMVNSAGQACQTSTQCVSSQTAGLTRASRNISTAKWDNDAQTSLIIGTLRTVANAGSRHHVARCPSRHITHRDRITAQCRNPTVDPLR